MKVGKPTSKRQTVRLRHKIQKASNAKQKKDRKAAKKNPQWVSRLKKDPGIPNLFPYKAKVLAEIEEARRRKEEDAQQKRDIAKAQRQGKVVDAKGVPVLVVAAEEDEDDVLLDLTDENIEDDDDDDDDDDEMEVQDESNPMAALLASAQARAQTFSKDDLAEEEDDEDEEDEEDDDEWGGIPVETMTKVSKTTTTPAQPTRKALPKAALEDPIEAVTKLIDQMQKTTDGIQRLIEHYQIPPLVTAGSDTTTRFLVDVARKRGRLGRGGVPNLNAAALCVLSDLNEKRLELPSNSPSSAVGSAKGSADGNGAPKSQVVKGVSVVTEMAQPFRIEGLFGNAGKDVAESMDVET